MRASRSSATRRAATWPASCPRTSSGRCACAMACISSAMRRCCASPFPTDCCSAPQLRKLAAHRAPLRPRLRALHHAPEPAATTGRSSRTCPTSWPSSRRVQMHAIQTSGNCIRNVTADHFAGIAPDEVDDPRPYCEIIRQWSTLHPEFTYLPRKFKIAVTGAPADRAASEVHDIGLHLRARCQRQPRLSGAGRRRPRAHADDRPGDPRVPAARAAARLSRGHPARLQPPGPARQHPQGAHQDPGEGARHRALPRAGRRGVAGQPRARAAAAARGNRARARASSGRSPTRSSPTSTPPQGASRASRPGTATTRARTRCAATARCSSRSSRTGGARGHDGGADGRARRARRARQLRPASASRTTRTWCWPMCRSASCTALWQALEALDLATPNIGTLTDMIACPGLDFCSLANAGTLDVAKPDPGALR